MIDQFWNSKITLRLSTCIFEVLESITMRRKILAAAKNTVHSLTTGQELKIQSSHAVPSAFYRVKYETGKRTWPYFSVIIWYEKIWLAATANDQILFSWCCKNATVKQVILASSSTGWRSPCTHDISFARSVIKHCWCPQKTWLPDKLY